MSDFTLINKECTSTSGNRLLLIKHRLNDGVIGNLFEDAYIKALMNDFSVFISYGKCDIDYLAEFVKPDLILFIGAYSPLLYSLRTQVLNPHAHSHIPRIGMFLGDGFCTVRPSFFSDMERWGVDSWFAATHVLMEQTPEVRGKTFGIPHIFDSELFADANLPRDIGLSVFGELHPWRKWRMETTLCLKERFGDWVQVNPHPGYGPDRGIGVLGKDFARVLCRSQFSISDGTIFHYILRKHLEIPACGAVLVSEPMRTLAEYGFVDMENCVIGSGSELADRLSLLRQDHELRNRIATAGHRLVHERHSAMQNHTVRDWFAVRRTLKPGQTIVQNGTFGTFQAVWDGRQGVIPSYTAETDPLARAMEFARKDYLEGNLSLCLDRLNHILSIKAEYAPARLLMINLLLKSGRPDLVIDDSRGIFLYNWGQKYYGGWEIDPTELSLWILTHICLRKWDEVASLLIQYEHVRHAELRRVKWLFESLQGRTPAAPLDRLSTDRPSVASQNAETFADWLSQVMAIISACWGK